MEIYGAVSASEQLSGLRTALMDVAEEDKGKTDVSATSVALRLLRRGVRWRENGGTIYPTARLKALLALEDAASEYLGVCEMGGEGGKRDFVVLWEDFEKAVAACARTLYEESITTRQEPPKVEPCDIYKTCTKPKGHEGYCYSVGDSAVSDDTPVSRPDRV